MSQQTNAQENPVSDERALEALVGAVYLAMHKAAQAYKDGLIGHDILDDVIKRGLSLLKAGAGILIVKAIADGENGMSKHDAVLLNLSVIPDTLKLSRQLRNLVQHLDSLAAKAAQPKEGTDQ